MADPNCIILDGGSSNGKSTLMRLLALLGCNTVEEAARRAIAEGVTLAKGRHQFRDHLWERQLGMEVNVKGCGKLFFEDRGLLTLPAHYRLDGMKVPERFNQVDLSHIALAVIVQPLAKFEYDGIRRSFEDLSYSRAITNEIEKDYQARGILTVRLEAMPIEERLRCLLALCRKMVPNLDKLAPNLVRE